MYTIFLLQGIYMAEGGKVQTAAAAVGVAGGGGAYMTPATPVVPLRPPMSRLGRRRSSGVDEFAAYPNPSQVESVASKTVPEIFSRTLAESWWSPAIETLQRQVHTHTHTRCLYHTLVVGNFWGGKSLAFYIM